MGGRKSIKEKLKDFKKNLNREMKIKEMILFGSRANGKARKESDVDLIIVSPNFRNLDFFQRGAKMYDFWDIDLPVDFLCYTPEEFENLKKRVTIVREANKSGIIID